MLGEQQQDRLLQTLKSFCHLSYLHLALATDGSPLCLNNFNVWTAVCLSVYFHISFCSLPLFNFLSTFCLLLSIFCFFPHTLCFFPHFSSTFICFFPRLSVAFHILSVSFHVYLFLSSFLSVSFHVLYISIHIFVSFFPRFVYFYPHFSVSFHRDMQHVLLCPVALLE